MEFDLSQDIDRLRRHILGCVGSCFGAAGGPFVAPYLAPGSTSYQECVWDWDAWLADVSLRQALADGGGAALRQQVVDCGRGSLINLLAQADARGWVPICIYSGQDWWRTQGDATNMAKPVLCQHAAFLVAQDGDTAWLEPWISRLEAFVARWSSVFLHADSGLYVWADDAGIGVDNDPCTFFRPPGSSASIFLNAMMVRELQALAWLLDRLGRPGGDRQRAEAERLSAAIRRHCWDEWTGFYYSCDVNLLPVIPGPGRHSGAPRNWPCLIQRIQVWSGFLALWAGIATPEQASRIASHWRDPRTFGAAFGVRTLSRLEAMYELRASGNPSCWLGPVWGVSNYLVFRGLLRYGLVDDARTLAERTIRLYAGDLERTGTLHEYYNPDSGLGIINPGFQNWNHLVLNMAAWLEGREAVTEWEPPSG